ncbi:MAG TPA: 2-dehydropantoate 2-reductase [Chloroflexota bacterium]|nr:2-dehydropantoate 2-reductase [Chloroflexota bacterium]
MRVAVVGAGGIGSVFGGRLAADGHEVWLVHRRVEHVDALRQHGLLLDGPHGREQIAVHATGDTNEIGTVDLILVLTKANDTHSAAEASRPLVGAKTTVVTLQNGLGNFEMLGEVLGVERVIVGMTYHGASLDAPGRVRHTAAGQTFIGEPDGPVSERVQNIAQAFTQAGIHTEVTDRLWSMVWGKLIVNAALNPSCALTSASGTEVLASRSLREFVGTVARECARVAAALAIELPYPDAAVRVWQHCQTIQSAKPSMLQDLERGRPTEIDTINGAIVRAGTECGVPTPLNQALLLLVKAREDIARSR